MNSITEKLSEKIKYLKAKYGEKIFPGEGKAKRRDTEEEMCALFNQREGDLNKYDGYDCKECKNRGSFMRLTENGNPVNYPCKCMNARKMLKNLKKSGLSTNLKKLSFDSFIADELWQENLKNSAIDFVKNENPGWFFVGGQSGCGKTHICTAITACFLRKGKTAHYMLWRDEIAKIKSVVTDFLEYKKLVDELKKVDVLYIDDLFKTGGGSKSGKIANVEEVKPTSADINIAFEIFNFRYTNDKLITVISSEKTISDIVKIDEAIAGRIIEKTGFKRFCNNIQKDPLKNFRFQNYKKGT